MGREPARLDFAVIGHQESWERVDLLFRVMRDGGSAPLSDDVLHGTFGYIPPRPVFQARMHSIQGHTVEGVYIETFIPPDELDLAHRQRNLERIEEACAVAAARASVVGLGGLTSVLLEMAGRHREWIDGTAFTTGNTLTAAFVCRGIEQAAAEHGIDLEQASLLIIGATGDIGRACVRWFAEDVEELLLCARQEPALAVMAEEHIAKGGKARFSTKIEALLPFADVIISVATSPIAQFPERSLRPHLVSCDSGYPKNLANSLPQRLQEQSFLGGFGKVTAGFEFSPYSAEEFYSYPVPHVAHGCMLEAIVMAMDGQVRPFSSGRGGITLDSMHVILEMASRHGVVPAPLFHQHGAWPVEQTL